MIRFISLKNDLLETKFSSVILEVEYGILISILDGQIGQSQELYFSIQNINKSTTNFVIFNKNGFIIAKKDKSKEYTYKNFYEFLSFEYGVVLEGQSFKLLLANSSTVNVLGLSQPDLNQELIKNLESKKTEFLNTQDSIKNLLNTEDLQKSYNRFTEVLEKISDVQLEIDSYQSNKDQKIELSQSIESVKKSIDSTSQMINSVSVLIEKRKSLQEKLSQYNYSQESAEVVKNLKSQKYEYINRSLLNSKVEGNSQKYNNLDNSSKKQTNYSKIVVIIAAITNFLAVLGYLYSFNQSLLILIALVDFIYIFFYTILRFLSDSLDILGTRSGDKSKVHENKAQSIINQQDPNESIFINVALSQAFKLEVDSVEESISKSLKGKSYSDLTSELKTLESELQSLENDQSELDLSILTTDEYYKKRREVDILKIEKENVEFSLKLDASLLKKIESLKKELNDLNSKIENANFLKAKLPVFIKNGAMQLPKDFDLQNRQVILVK